MLTGQPLVPDEKAANDETMLAWLIAMSGHKDNLTTPDTALGMKYFAENGTAYYGGRIDDLFNRSKYVVSGLF
jgi:hypothetical protein